MLFNLATVEVKIVKQMPAQAAGKKPTIAIITSRYYEKLAVDAMMEDKTTFVKYKTEGMNSSTRPFSAWLFHHESSGG